MNTSKPRTFQAFYWLLLMMAIAGFGIAIFIAMNWAGLKWAWILAGILAAYLIAFVITKTSAHEGVVTVLEMIFPGLEAFLRLQKKKYEYRGVIDKVEYVLGQYQLSQRLPAEDILEDPADFYSFRNKLRENLLNSMLRVQTDKTELEACIDAVARRMKPKIDKRIISLLYRETFGDDTQIIFAEIKRDERTLKQLAQVLMQSGHLPPITDGFPYNEEIVHPILKEQEYFDVKAVRDALLEEEKIWVIAQKYLSFMIKNQAADEKHKRKLEDVLESTRHKEKNSLLARELSNLLSRREMRTLAALLAEGENALKRGPLQNKCGGEALPAMNLTSLAMFFTEEQVDHPKLKSAVCKLAGRSDTAVNQHLAYLQAREELRPESPLADLPYVSVKYVAENWERIIGQLNKSPYYLWDKDIAIANLRDGDWWTRVPLLMKRLFRYMDEKFDTVIQAVNSMQKKYPAVEDVLRRIFRGLKLETIERLLEAQTAIPYLLTFDGQEGNLAEIIDSLSYFDGKENRAKLGKNKVLNFHYKGEEKYFFKQYTRNSRLGVVPKGMTFEEFSKTFERDLIKVYQYRKMLRLKNSQIDKFEIIIHRFGLHGRDRYGFDKVEAKSQNKHALPKIRDLFASSLTPNEILKAILYDKPRDKNGRVDMRPILEGILNEGMVWDFTDEDKVSLADNGIKTLIKHDAKLKKRVTNTLGYKSLLEAAKFLHESNKQSGPKTGDKTKKALAREIQSLPGFKKLDAQADVIAANYVEMLVDIAGVLSSLPKNNR